MPRTARHATRPGFGRVVACVLAAYGWQHKVVPGRVDGLMGPYVIGVLGWAAAAAIAWYAFRHAPDIYQIGFDVCTSYRSVAGDMTILDLYEIDSVDIFDTPR